jgi:hypothetical protein
MANLPIFVDPLSVVLWIRAMVEAMDRVGVVVPSAQIERLFDNEGYRRGMCSEDGYSHDSIHNTAYYLAGQFLSVLEPNSLGGGALLTLCDQWIQRWSPKD